MTIEQILEGSPLDCKRGQQKEHQKSGHIPLIDANPRRDQERKQELLDEQERRKLLNYKLCGGHPL